MVFLVKSISFVKQNLSDYTFVQAAKEKPRSFLELWNLEKSQKGFAKHFIRQKTERILN